MQTLKLCQNKFCFLYNSEDRIRTINDKKYYMNRKGKALQFWYDNFCTLNCLKDWLQLNIANCIEHIGVHTQSGKREKQTFMSLYSIREQIEPQNPNLNWGWYGVSNADRQKQLELSLEYLKNNKFITN